MQFIQGEGSVQGLQALVERLNTELDQDKQVLWLITGGSNLAVSVAAMATLKRERTKKLTILFSDERYGEVDHADSNAKQLYDAGFEAGDANFIPPLAVGLSLEATRERYSNLVQEAFQVAEIVIGQVGIGSDGHIAGILPHSPAVDSKDWVAAYETPTYDRFTLTFEALRHVTADYSFVFGSDKKPALEQLRDATLPLAEQPAQFLKELPEVYIFNDQIGDKA